MIKRDRIINSMIFIIMMVAYVQALTIKLGSLAPNGSPWDSGLRKIAAEWSSISKGKVKLKIYPGGIVGNEEDMIRKMRIGQLNAAGLTGVGMCRIFSGIFAIQLPLLIRTYEELDYVLEKMRPSFESELENKGFVALIWSKVGWVHFFSKNPIYKPEDLKKHKLFVYAGDPDAVQVWKKSGFNPVPLSPTDVMTALQSGMVNAFTAPTVYAASQQWFGLAKNMCGMEWGNLIGGIVISKKMWNKIPVNLRDKLLNTARKIGEEMEVEGRKAESLSIEVMKKNGLVINPVSPESIKDWEIAAKKGYSHLIGKSFDQNSYEQIKKYLNEFREKKHK